MARTGCAATLAFVLATLSSAAELPRPRPHMGHGGTTLFLVQATAEKVVTGSPSAASGTGAFLVDPREGTIRYDFTYHGLENGPARHIGLYNFGAGGVGELIGTLCGEPGGPCPDRAGANIDGAWTGENRLPLDGKLLGEFASARVYLEVVGGDDEPEIRGQLEPNGAMLPVSNFVAHLAPVPGAETRGEGTAVLSEVHFADGRVSVFYELTVAGTSGPPSRAALVDVPAAVGALEERGFTRRSELPNPRRSLSPPDAANGGTLSGEYEVDRAGDEALSVTAMTAEPGPAVGIVVSTARFPEGELFGAFEPVN